MRRARLLSLVIGILFVCTYGIGQVYPNSPMIGGGGGGSATPGGPTRSIQFNNAGAFDGSSRLKWQTNPFVEIDSAGITVPDSVGGATTEHFGKNSRAQGANSVSLGNAAVADAPASVAIGQGASTPTGGTGEIVAIGQGVVSRVWSVVIGKGAAATSGAGFPRQTVIGHAAASNGADGTVIGGDAIGNAANATGIGAGINITGTNGTALGNSAAVTHSHSTAVGAGAASTSANQVVLGTSADSVHVQKLYSVSDIATSGNATATGTVTGATAVVNQFGSVQPYRVWVALVADTGIVAVLQNTMGGAVTFDVTSGAGSYFFDKTGAFTASKTAVFIGVAAAALSPGPSGAQWHRVNADQIDVETTIPDVGGGVTNQAIANTDPISVEIRVYP